MPAFNHRFFASARSWVPVLLAAGVFLLWANMRRMERVETVSHVDAADAVVDRGSPTGYAGGKRWLIVPEHNNRSYQWIAETQQLFSRHEWRVRHIDYENAPLGREVRTASLYRWWLALLAWTDHATTGVPLALGVERAALSSDPLLHLLLLAGTSLYLRRRFGAAVAAVSALAIAFTFPFAGTFLPGVPDDTGLTRICALWSILPVLAARKRGTFVVAGVVGGVGLWLDPSTEVPLLAGLAAGAVVSALLSGRTTQMASGECSQPVRWRVWALAGAATSLLAYLIEYFPGHFGMHLEVNHPLFGLAWLGIGELLYQFELWRAGDVQKGKLQKIVVTVFAVLAISAPLLAAKWADSRLLWSGDIYATRLSFLPNGVVADNLLGWLRRDGLSAALVATCLPLLVFAATLWSFFHNGTSPAHRRAIVLACGPAIAAFAFACRQLSWWSACDATLIALLVPTSAVFFERAVRPAIRWVTASGALLLFLPGLLQLLPLPATGEIAFTRFEILGLTERTLAHWIVDRAGSSEAVVLAPPDQTVSLCYHGGFRGVGTSNEENRDGLEATVRIATANTADIAKTLIDDRGITHFVLPSWDRDLDAFARWNLKNPEDAFVMALHHWAIPPWLRPVPYPRPMATGFEDQSVVVLEVTRETNRAAALSRLAEYFVETGQLELAAKTAELLERYPAYPPALIALAAVDEARGNQAGFDRNLGALTAGIDNGFDRALPWDQRVSLAIVLALGKRTDLARNQVRLCLDKVDASRLRSLSTGSLYRLQVLAKAFDLTIADPQLRELAHRLLPEELRARL